MIKKLRIKFILLSMISAFIVLAVIITGINLANYRRIVSYSDKIIDFLSENSGSFHFRSGGKRENAPFPKGMSPETPYETRYFSVKMDSETGAVISSETSRISSVDSDQAVEYAKAAFSAKAEKGFIGSFRFAKVAENDGSARIIFVDCGRRLSDFYGFLKASIFISLIGYLIVFVVIALLSERIVRPISESYDKQKRFITDAGHEIKTPLTIINSDADVLQMDLGENEWLEDIKKQTKRLSGLTNDLILLAHMDELSNSSPMIDFPVSDVVGEAAASFQIIAQTQNKNFRTEIQPMLSMPGDEKKIRQLVGVLLDNALKYSPQGGNIELSLKKQPKCLVLSVRNTSSSPIDKKELPLFFDRFYRPDSSRSSETGGYGIGLSIAKAVTDAHKGRIQAETDDGSSLTVTAVFPQ